MIAWAAWTGRRDAGPAPIEAYDRVSHAPLDRSTGRPRSRRRRGGVIWIEDDAAGGNDVIRGTDSLTDEEFSITAAGSVARRRRLGQLGRLDRGARQDGRGVGRLLPGPDEVPARGCRHRRRDRPHPDVVWAAAVGRHSTAVFAWDRRTKDRTVVCRVAGSVSSLALSDTHAAWITTGDKTGPQVWAGDLETGKAMAVSAESSRQASPVIVSGTLYWADDRTGHRELYARSLQQ